MPGQSGVLTLRGDLKKSYDCNQEAIQYASTAHVPDASGEVLTAAYDRVGVPDLSVSGDKLDLVEDDPHDPTTTSEPEAPMQLLNQLPVVTDLVGARSA
jgi:hypothetical protein